MAIYVGNNNAAILGSDKSVVELYKGNKRIFGYDGMLFGESVKAENVHPIEHMLKLKLESDSITDFSDVKVKVKGKNLICSQYQESSMSYDTYGWVVNNDGTIVANGKKSGTWSIYLGTGEYYKPPLKNGVNYIFSGIDRSVGNIIMTVRDNLTNEERYFSLNQSTGFVWKAEYSFVNMYILFNAGVVLDNYVIKPQIEIGEKATEYEPPFLYSAVKSVTANADGTVFGLTSISPNMTLYTETDGVTVKCEYVMA